MKIKSMFSLLAALAFSFTVANAQTNELFVDNQSEDCDYAIEVYVVSSATNCTSFKAVGTGFSETVNAGTDHTFTRAELTAAYDASHKYVGIKFAAQNKTMDVHQFDSSCSGDVTSDTDNEPCGDNNDLQADLSQSGSGSTSSTDVVIYVP